MVFKKFVPKEDTIGNRCFVFIIWLFLHLHVSFGDLHAPITHY